MMKPLKNYNMPRQFNINKATIGLMLLIITCSFLISCAVKNKSAQPESNMNFNNKKILMVIAPKDFRDVEYLEPRKVFEQNGIEVQVASIQSGVATGADGAKVKIDLTVSQVEVNDYDAVVFVGGPGMAEILNDESMQLLAKKFYQANKLTTAICVAPAILAKAGILSGKQATVWSGVVSDLAAGGAIYLKEKVVQDGQLITASGPAAAVAFAEKIIQSLK